MGGYVPENRLEPLGLDTDYDVVIVGAGPGGLSCASNLAGSGLRVLILEKSPGLGKKICSGEISSKVFPGVDPSKKFKAVQEWRTVIVGTEKGTKAIRYDRPYLWTVGRYELESYLKSLCATDRNISIRFSEPVTAISKQSVQTGKARYRYRFLIGADGSFSKVREHLGLPTEHIVGYAFHYVVEKPSKEFRVYWLPKIFTRGYGYVMSRSREATMIGGAMAGKDVMHGVLAPRVKQWVQEEFDLDITKHRCEGFKGNADYRGWRFRTENHLGPHNIFLVGDAAGLLNPVTTEGIYYAIKSGEGVARHIRNEKRGKEIMDRLEATHRSQVLLFSVFSNPSLPFCWFVNWVFEDPTRGVRRRIFDFIFWRFFDQ
jgi:flavin-dependent dehydrogenase